MLHLQLSEFTYLPLYTQHIISVSHTTSIRFDTSTDHSSIFRMNTVMDTHSIVWTVNQGGLSASTPEVVQENVSSSLSKEGIASNTCDCVWGGGGPVSS